MTIVYAQRDHQGAVIGVYRARQPGLAEEAIDEQAADVAAFRDRPPPAPRDLAAEIDAIKGEIARARAAEAVLIEKAVVTKGEIDAKVTAREAGEIGAATR